MTAAPQPATLRLGDGRPPAQPSAAQQPALRPYQLAADAAITHELEVRGLRSTMLVMATGCHRAGQLVLLNDGSVRKVEDVVVGDQLMGPDGSPRTVLALARGRDEMVEIRPTKGAPWVVNLDHVLTLVQTNTGKPSATPGRIVEVSVREWLGWHRTAKHTHKLFRVAVEFDRQPVPRIDPYVLGVLLGDGGLKHGVIITGQDPEIWLECEREAKRWGLAFIRLEGGHRCPSFALRSSSQGPNTNRMLNELGHLGIRVGSGEKFIPDRYKLSLREIRLDLLAGLIDTDGHRRKGGGYELTSKSQRLAEDVAFVARSVGLAAYVSSKRIRYTYKGRSDIRTFHRVNISGDCSVIPCRVFRKREPERRQKKDALRTGFTIARLGTVEDYYGFALDGDQRYLLGDFTVTHNTGKTQVFVERVRRCKLRGGRSLILADRDELIQQPRRKLEALGISADVEKAQQRASLNAKVVIASVQTLRGARLTRFPPDHFDLVIADECDVSMASTWRAILDRFATAKILGVTATPLRADGQALGTEGGGLYESVAYRYEIRQAIRDGYLAPIRARRIVLDGVDLSAVKTRAGDLAQDQLAELLETERAISGVVVPLLEHAGERPTVVFGVDVAHAQALAQALNDRRPGCARSVDGDSTDREEILDAYLTGEFQFLVNCALLVRGWDAPLTSCVAIARPTKSWAFFCQMVGRGTRLSPETGKRDLLLLNFTGAAGRHRLIGPADCLAGSEQGPDLFSDDLRDELDRLLGTQTLELEAVLDRAAASTEQRRARLAMDAIVQFHAEEIDPFLGDANHEAALHITRPESAWGARTPTEAQLKALDRAGVTLKRIPPSFTMADASRLLGQLAARRARGLCSLAQAKRIAQGTGIDTRAITFERAKELCTLLRHGSWRPQALRGTPEWRAAHPGEPGSDEPAAQWHGVGLAPDPEQRPELHADHEALP